MRHAPAVILGPLIQLGVGRVLLSWIPPGRLGGHRRHELLATLGVSYLLGGLVLRYQGILVPGWGEASVGWHLLPWTVLLGLRLATLPAYYVAGREPEHEPYPLGLFLFLFFAALLLPLPDPSLGLLAFLPVLSHLLWQGRRAPRWRAFWAVLLLALTSGWISGLSVAPGDLDLALGAGFLIPWVRRNDFRAGALSAVFFLGGGLTGEWAASAVGWIALLAVSHAPQRVFAGKASLLAAGLGGLAWAWQGASVVLPEPPEEWWRWVVAAGVVSASAARWLPARERCSGEIDGPRREGAGIAGVLAGASVLGLPAVSLICVAVAWGGLMGGEERVHLTPIR